MSKKAAAAAAAAEEEAARDALTAVDSLSGLKHRFHPSRQHSKFMRFVADLGDEDILAPSNADEKAWDALSGEEKKAVIAEVVRIVVMRAHTGTSVLDGKSVTEGLKLRGIVAKISVK
jgi:hypothetical protein